jgi:HAD superfamily hydrolase (TIGR01484 family)
MYGGVKQGELMKSVLLFNHSLKFLFTDIDDTLTDEGQLQATAYDALWKLSSAGIHVVPVTGRPAGWCEMIARMWPVQGVIGENGAFYFRYKNQKMDRYFATDESTRLSNQKKLEDIREEVLKKIPGAAIASDQFCRLFDLAIDFCEDVPALNQSEINKIVDIFHEFGAQAKVSSIHVNGWFGNYDKLTMVLQYLKREWSIEPEQAKLIAGFSGDSPNDEPMFAYFPHSFGVANIMNFIKDLKSPPMYVANKRGGDGFVEIAEQIIKKLE